MNARDRPQMPTRCQDRSGLPARPPSASLRPTRAPSGRPRASRRLRTPPDPSRPFAHPPHSYLWVNSVHLPPAQVGTFVRANLPSAIRCREEMRKRKENQWFSKVLINHHDWRTEDWRKAIPVRGVHDLRTEDWHKPMPVRGEHSFA